MSITKSISISEDNYQWLRGKTDGGKKVSKYLNAVLTKMRENEEAKLKVQLAPEAPPEPAEEEQQKQEAVEDGTNTAQAE